MPMGRRHAKTPDTLVHSRQARCPSRSHRCFRAIQRRLSRVAIPNVSAYKLKQLEPHQHSTGNSQRRTARTRRRTKRSNSRLQTTVSRLLAELPRSAPAWRPIGSPSFLGRIVLSVLSGGRSCRHLQLNVYLFVSRRTRPRTEPPTGRWCYSATVTQNSN